MTAIESTLPSALSPPSDLQRLCAASEPTELAVADAPATTRVPLDRVELHHVADLPSLAGRDDGQPAIHALGTPSFRAGHFALAGSPAPASADVTAFVAAARSPNADPATLAATYSALSPADQQRATTDLIKRDPAAAVRFAGALAGTDEPAAQQAYVGFWTAVDASTSPGGALFSAPDKALAVMRAANDFAGAGADRLRLDAVEHMYTDFLGGKSYRHFGANEAGDIMADMLAKGTTGPELLAGYIALPADQQARFAARASDASPVRAADFALELRDAAVRDPAKQPAFDEMRGAAARTSERFSDEWTLRTGTQDERVDMLAKHYPDRFMAEIEPLAKTDPEQYAEYMQNLATHQPERFAQEFLRMDEYSSTRLRLDKSIRAGNSPAFRAVAHSREPGLVDMKRSMARDAIQHNPRQAFEMFAGDATVAHYMLHNHRGLVKAGIHLMLSKDPKAAQAFMGGVIESFTREHVRAAAAGETAAADVAAYDMGLMMGEFREVATDLFKASPKKGMSVYESGARGLLGVAAEVHEGAAVAKEALSWFDKARDFLRDVKSDPGMSPREIDKRFTGAFLAAASGAYASATGSTVRGIERTEFSRAVQDGIDHGSGTLDEIISN